MKKILAMVMWFSMPMAGWAADNYAVLFKAHGTYQEVRDQVQSAIEGKGLKINTTHKIAEMLERTGKDIGATKQIYECLLIVTPLRLQGATGSWVHPIAIA